MFSAIRPTRRRMSPIGRLTEALPALPRRHKKRQLHVGSGALVGPVLAALLIGITAVIFRDKLASLVTRVDGDTEQAPDAAEQAPAAGEE
jgi:hypothetical protein